MSIVQCKLVVMVNRGVEGGIWGGEVRMVVGQVSQVSQSWCVGEDSMITRNKISKVILLQAWKMGSLPL